MKSKKFGSTNSLKKFKVPYLKTDNLDAPNLFIPQKDVKQVFIESLVVFGPRWSPKEEMRRKFKNVPELIFSQLHCELELSECLTIKK